jgi:hypothetical protein
MTARSEGVRPGTVGVGRIRKQREHAFLSITAQAAQIDGLADDRRLIDFVIARYE